MSEAKSGGVLSTGHKQRNGRSRISLRSCGLRRRSPLSARGAWP